MITCNKLQRCVFNSCYGALGNAFFRFYDVRQAEAITTGGQLAINWVINRLNAYLNTLFKTENGDYVLAADTDSCYVLLDNLVYSVFEKKEKYTPEETSKIVNFLDKACSAKIQQFINKTCQEFSDYTNAYVNKMDMKREKICDVGIITSKKHYIWNVWDDEGVRYETPKVSVVGLEMVKSSLPECVRNKLKESVNVILGGTEDDLQKFIKEFKKEFWQKKVEEISFPRGLNGLTEYADTSTIYRKHTPIHVRGALMYNHYMKKKGLTRQYELVKDGEKVKFVYLKLPNPIRENVVAYPMVLPPELALHDHIDRDTMFSKAFLEPLKIILDVIGWNVEKKRSLF